MQIDFHHAVTYVLARLADFSQQEAEIIAYSAQYVDDATESGIIEFDNGALFSHEGSAHKMLDYRDFRELGTRNVWLPFHFLPGNMGLAAGKEPGGKFINKLICRPNSPVAQDMVKACIRNRHKPYGLHQLGITLHVYADTWAHQGFAGVNHIVNDADDLKSDNHKFDAGILNKIVSYFISDAYPLGHGAVLSYPDQPFLVWEYTNGLGERIRRDNPKDYLQAVDHIFHVLNSYRHGNDSISFSNLMPMPADDRRLIGNLFTTLTDKNGEIRHNQWLKVIADGEFSFGKEVVAYSPNEKRWKMEALTPVNKGQPRILAYPDNFLSANWTLFHDALMAHRFTVIRDILPQYQICAV
ncbi:MAG: DUF6765 family protein [Methylomonas sp.]